ncbi:MAG: hypothetical protein IIT48_01020 [Lachnospiraceae bacterium]|nr:hypothetical protein [Lachnospiraceae bacterium]
MIWVDGSDINIKQFSGEELCEKIATDMYGTDNEQWLKCSDFIQNALFIIDFDTVLNMEGFSTPYFGYFSKEYYSKIVRAFQTIGDVNDAEILLKAGRIDSFYSKILDDKKGTDEWSAIYDEFNGKLEQLEQGLYINTDFDIWSLLSNYLDNNIKSC